MVRLFKDGAFEHAKNPKEQLVCHSRFQRLIFMKTIGKQEPGIQEAEMLQQMPREEAVSEKSHPLAHMLAISSLASALGNTECLYEQRRGGFFRKGTRSQDLRLHLERGGTHI